MNPAIRICSGPSRRDGEARGQILTVPCAAARANHDSETPTRVAIPRHREPSRDRIRVGARAGALGNLEKPIVGLSLDTTNPARINSRESFTASRNRIPGSTRIEALQKSSHVRCPFTHVDNPFRVALASEKQSARKGKQGVGERPQELVKQGQGDE